MASSINFINLHEIRMLEQEYVAEVELLFEWEDANFVERCIGKRMSDNPYAEKINRVQVRAGMGWLTQ